MDKVPTFLLVATISAGVGAGVMWMITHGPGSSAGNIIQLGGNERPAKRVGFPEPFESPSPATVTAEETRRLDPEKLSPESSAPLASKSSEVGGVVDTNGSMPVNSSTSATARSSASLPSQLVSGGAPSLDSSLAAGSAADVPAGVKDALAIALEAAAPYVTEGFAAREDYWSGDLKDSAKAIQHQLFRGNEYWFWVGAETTTARISVHVYDSKGNLADSQHWQRGNTAAAHVVPGNTGTYYIIVSDKFREAKGSSTRPTVHWALTYGFR